MNYNKEQTKSDDITKLISGRLMELSVGQVKTLKFLSNNDKMVKEDRMTYSIDSKLNNYFFRDLMNLFHNNLYVPFPLQQFRNVFSLSSGWGYYNISIALHDHNTVQKTAS